MNEWPTPSLVGFVQLEIMDFEGERKHNGMESDEGDKNPGR